MVSVKVLEEKVNDFHDEFAKRTGEKDREYYGRIAKTVVQLSTEEKVRDPSTSIIEAARKTSSLVFTRWMPGNHKKDFESVPRREFRDGKQIRKYSEKASINALRKELLNELKDSDQDEPIKEILGEEKFDYYRDHFLLYYAAYVEFGGEKMSVNNLLDGVSSEDFTKAVIEKDFSKYLLQSFQRKFLF